MSTPPCQPLPALAGSTGTFYGAAIGMRRISQTGDPCLAVIVPFESHSTGSIDQLVELVATDMERVNATILSRTGSEVTMIPDVANHLISSGDKRLRPMLTLAMANLAGYSGKGNVK